MVDINALNKMYQDLVRDYNELVEEKNTLKETIKKLEEKLSEYEVEEIHRTKDGTIVKLKDMTNLHILRYLRIKFENNYDDRARFLQELLNRSLEHYGCITIEDAKELGFCSTGIIWAKKRFYVENGKVSPRALLLYLAHAENDLTYCVHIIDALIHFCYKFNLTNSRYESELYCPRNI